MQAPDSDHLFRSSAELEKESARHAKSLRTAKAGSPFQLGSKPLDLAVRPNTAGGSDVYTAESGFVARKLDLQTGKTLALYKGHTGPVTSLAFYKPRNASSEVIFTASWDKSIRAYDSKTSTVLSVNSNAHADFVKCLHVVPQLEVLISGGSDKDIRIWDLSKLHKQDWTKVPQLLPPSASSYTAATVEKVTETVKTTHNLAASSIAAAAEPAFLPLMNLASLKSEHTRPIETFASSPITVYDKEADDSRETGRYVLWSADSMGRTCIWELWRDANGQIRSEHRHTWLAHETAIYEISMNQEGEAWTVSADQLATLWTFDTTDPSSAPIAILKLPHPYYVKSILPLEHAIPGSNIHYLLTGSTDEQIRIWDLSLLDPSEGAGAVTDKNKKPMASAATASEAYKNGKRPPGLVYDLEGHFHEVIRLALWSGKGDQRREVENQDEPKQAKEDLYIISAGLDCTIRKWRLRDILELAKAATKGGKVDRTQDEKRTINDIRAGKEEQPKSSAMTAEEEAELAELME